MRTIDTWQKSEQPVSSGKKLRLGAEERRQLKELTDHYQDSYEQLHKQAYKIVDSLETADDVVQDAFANTASAIAQGKIIDNLSGWLNRCVYNCAVNYYERGGPKPHSLGGIFNLVDEGSSVELAHSKILCNEKVLKALNEITPTQRLAFLLSEMRGLNHSEIAEIIGCSTNSVAQLLMRARSHLRYVIGKDAFSVAGLALTATPKIGIFRHASERATGLLNAGTARLAHLYDSLVLLAQRSSEVLAQPVTALLAGAAAVVAISSPSLGDWKDARKEVADRPTATKLHIDSERRGLPETSHKESKPSSGRQGEGSGSDKQRNTSHGGWQGRDNDSQNAHASSDSPNPVDKKGARNIPPSEDKTSNSQVNGESDKLGPAQPPPLYSPPTTPGSNEIQPDISTTEAEIPSPIPSDKQQSPSQMNGGDIQ